MSRKRNHQFAMRRIHLHQAEKAKLRHIWSEQAVEAQIHALIGNDVARAVEKTAAMFYVVMRAAQTQRRDENEPDLRIITSTTNLIEQCVGRSELTDLQRRSLTSGIAAVGRVARSLPEEALLEAAVHTSRVLGLRALLLTEAVKP